MSWVMIVDDDAESRAQANVALQRGGIQVTTLESGQKLLDSFTGEQQALPDLILLGSRFPGIDGLETLEKLRNTEAGRDVPVIFLSGEAKAEGMKPDPRWGSSDPEQIYLESEKRSLRLGAIDYIRKPFVPDILLRRVQNALKTQKKLLQFERDARIDQMTGFLNKYSAEDRLNEICRREQGLLCVLDLDSFKLINDIYGHDVGDRALILFSDLLKQTLRTEDVCGRIGGDEFLLFAKDMKTETDLLHFTERINRDYLQMMKTLMGESLQVSLGVSIGAASVPEQGTDFRKLFHLADQALMTVKQNGKHSCALSGSPKVNLRNATGELDLNSVTMILEERNISTKAMWMGREAFINVYRYMVRYMERYHGVACRVLFTVNMRGDKVPMEKLEEVMEQFRGMIQTSLRNSDVMVEISANQIFLLLPETRDHGVDVVIDRLMAKWNASPYREQAEIVWEAGQVHLGDHDPHI